MKADLNLKETLVIFDRNSDGTVSYRDFHELLSELDLGEDPTIALTFIARPNFLPHLSQFFRSLRTSNSSVDANHHCSLFVAI